MTIPTDIIEMPPAAEFNHMPNSWADEWKSRNTVPLKIHAREYLNLQAQYISSAAVEATLAEVQDENFDREDDDDEQRSQITANMGKTCQGRKNSY